MDWAASGIGVHDVKFPNNQQRIMFYKLACHPLAIKELSRYDFYPCKHGRHQDSELYAERPGSTKLHILGWIKSWVPLTQFQHFPVLVYMCVSFICFCL